MRLSGICVYKHEATASLDVENETLIQTALSRLIREKTVLVIAHRMRTVAGADKIVVLDNVLGCVTNEQFRILSVGYNAGQKALEWAISAKEEQLDRLKASAANMDAFIEKAKQ